MLTSGSSDLYKHTHACQDEAEAFRVVREPSDSVSSGGSGTSWRGWRGSRNTFLLHLAQCRLVWAKALQRVLQAGEKHPWAASGKSSFPVLLAGSLEQIHSLCQPRGALPLAVLPPAAAHTLLLLIVWRRQQHALFGSVCSCPESRELCGSCFCTGRWIWE